MNRLGRRLAGTTSLVAGALASLTPLGVAYAQTADTTDEEIVVTGTRIRAPNMESVTPTVTIGAERLEAGSDLEVGGLLRDLPSSGIAAGTPQTTAGLVTTSFGISTFNLRNLSENRTLVLVDGRRFVSGVPGQNIVDLNAIPPELVDRIDVVTGGASAVYGSDALAGVVNIILRDDFEGVVLTGQGGITDAGDAENFRASLVGGSDFEGGRGHATVTLGWSRENGAFARDRDFLQTDSVSLAALGAGPSNDVYSILVPFLSSYSERGRFNVPNGTALTVEDDGTVRPFSTALDGFNRNPNRAISAQLERFSAAFDAEYQISDHVNWFGQGIFNTTVGRSFGEGFPLDGYNIYGGNNPANTPQCADFDSDGDEECKYGVPINSAIVPTDIRDAVIAANPTIAPEDLVVGFRRRMTEVGNRDGEQTRQTFRISTGFEGDITYSDLAYEASLTYGRTNADQSSDGQINVVNMRYGLDVEVGPGGVLRCRDEAARLDGCVPVDIFGAGNISPQAANYINAESSRSATVDQLVFNAFLTGDAFQWGDRPATFVLGVEHRQESTEDVPDRLTQSGLNASNITPPTQGRFWVHELFGELRVPLLQNVAFADELDLNLAARVSDYSTVGLTNAYAAGLDWRITDDFRARGQYARAVRAPNIFELFSGAQQTFPVLNDPCQGLTTSGGQAAFFNDVTDPTSGIDPTTVGANTPTRCLADPNLAARVTRDGFFIPSQPELQGTGGFTSGNPELEEETAETFSVGFVWQPKDWLQGLSLSLDYYDITIENAISTFGRQLTIDRCYTTGEAEFCNSIQRAAAGDFVGFLALVNQSNENLAELNVEGVDLQFDYSTSLGSWGDLGLSVLYSHLLEQSNVPLPGASLVDDTGEFGAPENRANIGVTYSLGNFRLRWDARIIGEQPIDNDPTSAFAGAKIGLRHIHDLQASWQANPTTRFTIGVDNVLNEYVFIGGTAGDVGSSILATTTGHRTAPELYDGLGRRGYAALRLAF